jgi:hypothetical protein
MRYGNLLQLLAIITLFALTIFEYQRAKNHTEEIIYRLKVQKSFSGRQSFASEYGPDYKKVIPAKIEENRQHLLTLWNEMMYKFLAVIVLTLISVFHFIRYFYIWNTDEDERLRLHQYDASTWFLNFLFFAFVSLWYAYFSGGSAGATIGYILGILCATKCLWHVSVVVQSRQIKKLKGIRIVEIGIATLIYFHLIGFVFIYYATMFLKLPMLLDLLRGKL